MSNQSEYDLLTRHPRFAEIRARLAELVEDEAPESAGCYTDDEQGRAAFIENFRRVERAEFSPWDPELVERSRNRDTDASQQLLIKSGICDELRGK